MPDKRSLVEQLTSAQSQITELERAYADLAYLAAVIESADDAVITKNLNGIVTTWNPAAEKTFGYTAEEMIGKPIAMLLPPDRPQEENEILRRLRLGERIERFETQRMRKDGRIVDVSITVSPIRNDKGTIIGASKVARDITERKRVEARERDALRQAQIARQDAEKANRAKDDFLATISHELRTPLTATLGWTRMLAAGTLDEASKAKAIEVIERNVLTQAQLIEDLLDISRIISGKLRIEVKPVETPGLIDAALEVIRPAAEAKQIGISTVVDSAASPISGDFQ